MPALTPLQWGLAVLAAVWLLRRSYRLRRERLDRLGNQSIVSRLVPAMVLRSPTWRITRLASAGLLIGVAAAIVSGVLVAIGLSRMSGEALKPKMTIEQFQHDKAAAREMVR